jgi:hypothetical protein
VQPASVPAPGGGQVNGAESDSETENAPADWLATGPRARVGVFDANSLVTSNGGGMGLVLVTPQTVTKTELDELQDLVRVSRRNLLGVISTLQWQREQL